MIRVLGLTLYGQRAASTRYRITQYQADLLSDGIDLDVRALLDDDYLLARYQGAGLPLAQLAKAYWKRVWMLLSDRDHDLYVVNAELLPWVPSAVERLLLKKPYIYDFDDAFYLRYSPQLGSGCMASLLQNKFASVVEGAAAVTAGSRSLYDFAYQYNQNTSLLPTVVDTTRFVAMPGLRDDRALTIGWIGSPTNHVYLQQMVEPLTSLAKQRIIRFVVVGAHCPAIDGVEVVCKPWSEETEVQDINSFDIGIMPLHDDPWARGKCGFKLIQYLACEVPVVASAVGANLDIVGPEVGLLASNSEQWHDALLRLANDANLRHSMGVAGRKLVREKYSLASTAQLLSDIIRATQSGQKVP
jgi:glycosyltransferase involved in cell wall biosynthesis